MTSPRESKLSQLSGGSGFDTWQVALTQSEQRRRRQTDKSLFAVTAEECLLASELQDEGPRHPPGTASQS